VSLISVSDTEALRRPESESREKLLLVGTQLMAERGVEGVNSNTMARAAGVGVGTFYRHFEDKYALLRAVVGRGLEALQAELAEADREAAEAPLGEQVRATVSAFVHFALREPAGFRLIFSLAAGGGPRGRAGLGFSPRAIENRLRALQADGQIDPAIDPAVAARAFTAAQAQAVLWWIQEPDHLDREALIETLVRLHPAVACRS